MTSQCTCIAFNGNVTLHYATILRLGRFQFCLRFKIPKRYKLIVYILGEYFILSKQIRIHWLSVSMVNRGWMLVLRIFLI